MTEQKRRLPDAECPNCGCTLPKGSLARHFYYCPAVPDEIKANTYTPDRPAGLHVNPRGEK